MVFGLLNILPLNVFTIRSINFWIWISHFHCQYFLALLWLQLASIWREYPMQRWFAKVKATSRSKLIFTNTSWSFLPAVFSIGVSRSPQFLCTSSQGPLLTSTTVCTRFSIIPFQLLSFQEVFWHEWYYYNDPPQTVSEALNGGISDRGSFEGSPEQSHMSITSITAFVTGLPDADYYLIEEMLPILPKV